MNYQSFIYEDYEFNQESKKLTLKYSFDSFLTFTEEYFFDFDFVEFDNQLLERSVQVLFFMAGVSYFKAYPSTTIQIKKGQLDRKVADFFGKTYQNGLGEFFYTNKLDPTARIDFPTNIDQLEVIPETGNNSGLLVGIGGGKDSLVSVELLRKTLDNISTWSVGHRPQLSPFDSHNDQEG